MIATGKVRPVFGGVVAPAVLAIFLQGSLCFSASREPAEKRPAPKLGQITCYGNVVFRTGAGRPITRSSGTYAFAMPLAIRTDASRCRIELPDATLLEAGPRTVLAISNGQPNYISVRLTSGTILYALPESQSLLSPLPGVDIQGCAGPITASIEGRRIEPAPSSPSLVGSAVDQELRRAGAHVGMMGVQPGDHAEYRNIKGLLAVSTHLSPSVVLLVAPGKTVSVALREPGKPTGLITGRKGEWALIGSGVLGGLGYGMYENRRDDDENKDFEDRNIGNGQERRPRNAQSLTAP